GTVCGAVFVIFAALVAMGYLTASDRVVAQVSLDLWRSSFKPIAVLIEDFGNVDAGFVAFVILTGFVWWNGPRRAIPALFVVPAGVVVEALFKHLLFHPGPDLPFNHGEPVSLIETLLGNTATDFVGNSFPSGHMTRTVVIYGMVVFLMGRYGVPLTLRKWSMRAFLALVTVMAIDRIYLGVHWESDVIGGLLLGGCLLAVGTLIFDSLVPERA
ncbi:MAG TPA: phosphatase PAP2 family protein, partial [Candidatus Dormibacteraeota bacterium]|nr:phosphatase PAP2 family protein [Candidatus Dormibacteraeota bacterium]